MRQRNGSSSVPVTSQANAGAAERRADVLDYRGPSVVQPELESEHAAIARKVYHQMSQPAPPSVAATAIGRLMTLVALAGGLIALTATIGVLWRAVGGI